MATDHHLPAGQPAVGPIKPDGSYELTTDNPGDGAIIGEHKVAVVSVDNSAAKKSVIPEKYSTPNTTPLTKTVKAGDNAIDLEVTD